MNEMKSLNKAPKIVEDYLENEINGSSSSNIVKFSGKRPAAEVASRNLEVSPGDENSPSKKTNKVSSKRMKEYFDDTIPREI